MAGPQETPLHAAYFAIELQGQIKGAFKECSGFGSESEVVEYKASGPKGEFVIKKGPGRLKWENITLKRGATDNMEFWKWRKQIEDGNVETARKNGSIVLFNYDYTEVARWNFVNAWPSKITGSGLNAESNEIAIEEMEIVHEGLERVK